ncbi:MAG: dephospho-CoA kinase [Candidatus Caldarchaeum sp.]
MPDQGVKVAITGGPCDGKSTVLYCIRDMGFPVVQADEVVQRLYASRWFCEVFSRTVSPEFIINGTIDRFLLLRAMVEEGQLRRRLNSLIHPLVFREILWWMEGHKVAFAEVPLLVESVTFGCFDFVWVVDAGEEERFRRLQARLGGDEGLARRLLGTQLPTAGKHAFADEIIRTNCPLEAVRDEVKALVVRMARS